MSNIESSFEQITLDQLYDHLKNLKAGEIILDVRTQEEFQSGHIPNAINIPYDEIDKNVEKLKGHKHLSILCRSGKRALYACQTLQSLGFTEQHQVFGVFDSGMHDWILNNWPIEIDSHAS